MMQQQGVGLRVERAGFRGCRSSSRPWVIANPLLYYGSHGVARVAMAAQRKAPAPRVVRLRKEEVADVLPWSGSGEQRLRKLGTPTTWMARLALSLAGSAALYNYNTLAAAMASLFWAWDPILSTALANTTLRVQYPHAGVWKARVLYSKVVRPAPRSQSVDVFQEIFDAKPIPRPLLKLVIGDESSATLEMKVGVPGKRYQVRIGEPVEVLVLSDVRSLARFMAVRDVYLPNMGIWLSEDPCVERKVFEVLSEDLREVFSSPTMLPPSKIQGTRAVAVDLPESGAEVGERSLKERRLSMDRQSAAGLTSGREDRIRLSDENFERIIEEDLMFKFKRKAEKKQSMKELQRRGLQVEADCLYNQYMDMQNFSGNFEDRRGQDKNRWPTDFDQTMELEVSEWENDLYWGRNDRPNSSREPVQMQLTDGVTKSNWDLEDELPRKQLSQMRYRVSDNTWPEEDNPQESKRVWTFEGDLESSWTEDKRYRQPTQRRQMNRIIDKPVNDVNMRFSQNQREEIRIHKEPLQRQRSSRSSKDTWELDEEPLVSRKAFSDNNALKWDEDERTSSPNKFLEDSREDDFEQPRYQEKTSYYSIEPGQIQRDKSAWEYDKDRRSSRTYRGNQQFENEMENMLDEETHIPTQSWQKQVSDGDIISMQELDEAVTTAVQPSPFKSGDERSGRVPNEGSTFRPSREPGQMQSYYKSDDRRAPENPESERDYEKE